MKDICSAFGVLSSGVWAGEEVWVLKTLGYHLSSISRQRDLNQQKSHAMTRGGILMEQGGNIPDKIWAFLFLVWKNQRQGENEKNGKVDCMSLIIYCYEYEANTRERRHSRLLVFLKTAD